MLLVCHILTTSSLFEYFDYSSIKERLCIPSLIPHLNMTVNCDTAGKVFSTIPATKMAMDNQLKKIANLQVVWYHHHFPHFCLPAKASTCYGGINMQEEKSTTTTLLI